MDGCVIVWLRIQLALATQVGLLLNALNEPTWHRVCKHILALRPFPIRQDVREGCSNPHGFQGNIDSQLIIEFCADKNDHKRDQFKTLHSQSHDMLS